MLRTAQADLDRQQHANNYTANCWSGVTLIITFAYRTVFPTIMMTGLPMPDVSMSIALDISKPATTRSSCYHQGMTISNTKSALLLFAHGSSDPGWAAPFIKLKAAIQSREPGRIVELAFLERMQPSFDAAVAILQKQDVVEITIAPIFLATGGHMRKDLPALIETTHQRTGITFRVLPVLGESDSMIEFIATWVLATAGG